MPINRRELLASAFIGTLAPTVATAQALNARSVRVGLIPTFSAGQAFYAVELGMFRRHNLDVQIQFMNNGASIAAAVAGGSLDIGFTDVISIAAAHLRGFEFIFVAPGFINTQTAPGFNIIVRADSQIQSAKDLNGKTIGINAVKSISQLAVDAWVDGNGGDSSSLKFVELPFAQMVASVQQKTIDGCVPGEPLATSAIDDGMLGLPLARNGLNNYMPGGYFATRTWIAANADITKRFSLAIREASILANHRPIPAEVTRALSKYTNVPLAIVKRLRQQEYGVGLKAPPVQVVIDSAARYGIIPRTFPAAEILDSNVSST